MVGKIFGFRITNKAKISITDKFIIYSVFIYVISAGTLTYFIIDSAEDAIMMRTFDQLTSVRIVKTKQIETFFKDRIFEIDKLNHIDGGNKQTAESLDDFINTNAYFDAYVLIDEGFGPDIFSKGLIPDTARFYQLLKKHRNDSLWLTDYVVNNKINKYEMYTVIKLAKETGKYVFLRLRTEPLIDIMLGNNPEDGLGNSGESYIVGEDFLMRSPSRFIKNSTNRIKVRTSATIKALNKQAGTEIIKDYRGIRVLSSWGIINVPRLNWAIVAEIDYNEAFNPILVMRVNVMLILAILTGVIFTAVFIVSKRYTKPILLLKNATNLLADGNFKNKLDITTKDEVGELTESFNILIDKLYANEQQLEDERLKRFSLVMDSQEKEKERLSRELHDGIGQLFIAMKLKLENIDSKNYSNDQNLESIKSGLDEIISEIRRISNNLMPSVLNEFGIVAAIHNLFRQLNSYQKVLFSFESNFDSDITDKKKKIYLYRIVQEAVTNIIKHSGANYAEVKLLKSDSYKLIIVDDGKGFDYTKALDGAGNGIYNIRERVHALNGRINIDSSDQGTAIIINLPL